MKPNTPKPKSRYPAYYRIAAADAVRRFPDMPTLAREQLQACADDEFPKGRPVYMRLFCIRKPRLKSQPWCFLLDNFLLGTGKPKQWVEHYWHLIDTMHQQPESNDPKPQI